MSDEIQRHDKPAPVSPEEWHGDVRQPFDRLDDETSLQYGYFWHYVQLGHKRSIKQTAQDYSRERRTLQELASRFSWQHRAQAWDDYINLKARRDLEADIMDERKKTAALVRVARDKVMERVLSINPNELSARDAITWLDTLTKIGRQAHGDVDVKRIEHTGKDGGPIEMVEKLDAGERAALMAQAMKQLEARLGVGEIEGEIEDADIVEDDDAP